MRNKRFIKKFESREAYIASPFSRDEYLTIINLCEREKSRFSNIVIFTTVLCASIALLGIIGKEIGSQSMYRLSITLFFLTCIGLIPASFFLGAYAKITIESVTFKSFDSLGQHKHQSDDRFYPTDMIQNVYARGTSHYEFVNKIRAMDRPLMRFEVDLLNSLSE